MGWTYLIRADGTNLYKIGVTSRTPEDRLSSLQTASPHNLKLCYASKSDFARKHEARLHEKYSHKRESGEWFRLDDSDVADVCAEMREFYRQSVMYDYVLESPKEFRKPIFDELEYQAIRHGCGLAENFVQEDNDLAFSFLEHLLEWDDLPSHPRATIEDFLEEYKEDNE